ncbi:MAG: radical SAM protein [Desulfobacteraceae bacterium]|nr:radical SAM protein [Desulfobacteraceae bacterium]
MHYEGTIIRPPSEAFSIILQVTVGCSHDKCTFCGTYKGVRFRLKEEAIIEEDLEFAARYCRRQNRVFLADGDVLSLPRHRLLDLFSRVRTHLPWVRRISLYGNERSIRGKSEQDLRALKEAGLDRVYMGLESGHDQTLAVIRKGASAEAMVRAGRKVRASGLFLSVTVLLGIAGDQGSLAHAEATGRVLTAMAPSQIGVLSLMLLPNTDLYRDAQAGRFTLPSPRGLLRELRTIIDHIDLDRVQLQSNHASNHLAIDCRLSRDKAAVLARIDRALQGEIPLKPEYLRGL